MSINRQKLIPIIVLVFGAVITYGLLYFNRWAESYNLYILGNLLGLSFVPILLIFGVFKNELNSYGLCGVKNWTPWLYTGIMFLGLFILMVLSARWSSFQAYYPIFKHFPEFRYTVFADYPKVNPFITHWQWMLYAMFTYGFYLFWWEFFFRGFLLFGLAKWNSFLAVVLQALAFGLLHAGKPPTEVAASFIAGIILGILALRSGSILPCFVLHWAASVSFDILVVGFRQIPK
ncbi:MAG: CPBP family intramembrane glutamic endopeptidase [Armatimonadota bacterium]